MARRKKGIAEKRGLWELRARYFRVLGMEEEYEKHTQKPPEDMGETLQAPGHEADLMAYLALDNAALSLPYLKMNYTALYGYTAAFSEWLDRTLGNILTAEMEYANLTRRPLLVFPEVADGEALVTNAEGEQIPIDPRGYAPTSPEACRLANRGAVIWLTNAEYQEADEEKKIEMRKMLAASDTALICSNWRLEETLDDVNGSGGAADIIDAFDNLDGYLMSMTVFRAAMAAFSKLLGFSVQALAPPLPESMRLSLERLNNKALEIELYTRRSASCEFSDYCIDLLDRFHAIAPPITIYQDADEATIKRIAKQANYETFAFAENIEAFLSSVVAAELQDTINKQQRAARDQRRKDIEEIRATREIEIMAALTLVLGGAE